MASTIDSGDTVLPSDIRVDKTTIDVLLLQKWDTFAFKCVSKGCSVSQENDQRHVCVWTVGGHLVLTQLFFFFFLASCSFRLPMLE